LSSGYFFVTLREMRKFIFCFCFAAAVSVSGAEIKIDFGDVPIGQTPVHFHGALAGGGKPGDWKIVADKVPSAFAPLSPQAPAVNRQTVLAQTSQEPTGGRFPMLIYDGEMFKDFKLTTQFKIVGGGLEQMAGVVFHFQNESNFYAVCADASGNKFQCYKVENGLWKPPFGQEMTISTGDWHELAVQCDGNRIVCSLDGKDAIKLVDSTYSGNPGKIGFGTKADTVAHFGDTTIDYTPRVPAAQALVQNIMQKYPRILGLRIYTLNDKGEPRIIASKNEKEIGQPGTDAEKNAITKAEIFFGRGKGTVALTLPLRDRNGDPMAAVRVELKSFFGETQDTALTRATMILKEMRAQVLSKAELTQ
jgi:3-keto-disaccharide hydrolase